MPKRTGIHCFVVLSAIVGIYRLKASRSMTAPTAADEFLAQFETSPD